MKFFTFGFFFFLPTLLFNHEVQVKISNVEAKLVQIYFGDGSYFANEKCEIAYFENGEFKAFQIVNTNSYGEFVFLPKKSGKYKIQCYRADGHGVYQEIEITDVKYINHQSVLDWNYYLKYLIGFFIILFLFFLLKNFKKKENFFIASILIFFIFPLYSHHGIASLGNIGIRGPGAAIETSTQGILPENQWLYLMKIDSTQFRTFTTEKDEEMLQNQFYLYGIGYGFYSFLSMYVFVPYNQKTLENNSYNISGFADPFLYLVLGFKYDKEFLLNPRQENLDDLQDYHFSIYLGNSLSTGNPNIKTPEGDIEPAMALGFGKPVLILGGTISKFYEAFTWNYELSYLKFQDYTYADGKNAKFGDEFRSNISMIYRLYYDVQAQIRLDIFLELNFLKILPDKEKGITNKQKIIYLASQNNFSFNNDLFKQKLVFSTVPPWEYEATIENLITNSSVPSSNEVDILASFNGIATNPSGGDIYYVLPGFRIYYKNMSFAMGLKLPIHFVPNKVDLNTQYILETAKSIIEETEPNYANVYWNYKVLEEHLYQGSEGKEKYRIILSLSFLF
ncbi:MAG: hypothetical protein ACK4UJ_06510 [Leptonema sp. (in: bacteria)]